MSLNLPFRRRQRSTLFPYTTLFRSSRKRNDAAVLKFLANHAGQIRVHGPGQGFLAAGIEFDAGHEGLTWADRKSTRVNSSHANISYAVFCLIKKLKTHQVTFSST